MPGARWESVRLGDFLRFVAALYLLVVGVDVDVFFGVVVVVGLVAVVAGTGLTAAADGLVVVTGVVIAAFFTTGVGAVCTVVPGAGLPLTIRCCWAGTPTPRCPDTFCAFPWGIAVLVPLLPPTNPLAGEGPEANAALLVPGTRLGKFRLYVRTGMAMAPFWGCNSSIVKL
jgi:hypothetical protein